MKKCSNCDRILDEGMFHKNKAMKDGLQGWCKECKSKYAKEKNSFIKESKKEKPEEERIIFMDYTPISFNAQFCKLFKKFINSEKELVVPLNKVITFNMQNNKLYIKYKK